MASGERQSNPSTSGDAGGDHNEDYGNEYGPPLPTQEELREMEYRRLVGEATNTMLNVAKDPNLAKYMTKTTFQDVHAQWKATLTSPPNKKQYSEKEVEEEEAVVSSVPSETLPAEGAQELLLAMDPNREGEALAWHVVEVMKAEGLLKFNRVRVRRVLFNEVTKSAVLHAMQAPQRLRFPLVDAHLCGCALDHLVGFSLSPLLWRMLPGSLSAGRLRFAALQLVCNREKAVKEFVPQESWTLDIHACFADESESFLLTALSVNGGSFDAATHSALAEKLKGSLLKVSKVTKEFKERDPPEPYITSTLQEDAQAILGFGAERTMTLAQKLHEGVDLGKGELTGLITCPCTGELKISKQVARDIGVYIAQRFGSDYIPPIAREFQSKVINSLEAHEAIRATNVQRIPSALCLTLDKDALALYTLIWIRTVESQMKQAIYEEVSVDFVTEVEALCLRATVNHLGFPGFLAASMAEGTSSSFRATFSSNHLDHQDSARKSRDKVWALKEGDVLCVKKAETQQHFTSAPVRYSEGLLVKAMAEAGIGRPSTYASIVKSLQTKKYVRIENQQIIPEVQGLMVISFLSHYLSNFVDCNTAALLEKLLDEVSSGRLQSKEVLRNFWPAFNAQVSAVMKMTDGKMEKFLHEAYFTQGSTELGFKGRVCPRFGTGKLLLKRKRIGRGYYLSCSCHPLCRYHFFSYSSFFKTPNVATQCATGYTLIKVGNGLSLHPTHPFGKSFKARVIGEKNENAISECYSEKTATVSLGVDPVTNLQVTVKSGPYGAYIQLGEDEKGLECFKLPHGLKPTDVNMEQALQLMKYPLELGKHPEDGQAVILGLNNKCYFVKHQSTIAKLSKKENIEGITLERALKLLKQRNKSAGKLRVEKTERKTECEGKHEDLEILDAVATDKKGKIVLQPVVYSEPNTCNRTVDTKGKRTSTDGRGPSLQQVAMFSEVFSADNNISATVEAGRSKPSRQVQEKANGLRGRKRARVEAEKEAENCVPAAIVLNTGTGQMEGKDAASEAHNNDAPGS
ncbi:hypothetical protein L7F22_018005 [Adiantum nelumboides]|nr:hypothetical protein [Adiantum nelumboides]